ncbi:hydroxymethylglutaryl-CoA lyase [Rhizobiales bacterium GAS191]|nr:hydroxymethylglutaryl-CoA lyase [Rhizobiales bacterium GAS191]
MTPPLIPTSGSRVAICEAWLRDGIQGWPNFIATPDKLEMLKAVVAAGIGEVDVTSFVSRRLVPQFADCEDVLAAGSGRARTRVLTVNADGARRVAEAHRNAGRIDRCGMPFSVSEPHNVANLRRTHAEHREVLARIFDILLDAGIQPLLGVVTAFGCPIRGSVASEESLAIAEWGVKRGITAIMFGDTTGMANPRSVAAVFGAAHRNWPEIELIAHFHDNRGCGIANSLAAIASGAATVDACLGGIGGEPKGVEQGVVGDQGNTTTEDLVAVLSEMGIETNVDLHRLVEAGRLAEEITGRRLLSRVQRSGLAADVGNKAA